MNARQFNAIRKIQEDATMNGKQFSTALEILEIESHSAAGRILGIGRRSVIRYVQDETEVPESVRRLITMLLKHGVPKEFA